ncbi:MAG: hypothetical protein GX558_07010, partial [Clostridiales bacterium]|nr:hypothetical protein [Clostridiales bacterium]
MSRRTSALALALALLLSLLPTFAAADPPPPTGISVAPSPAIAYLGEPLALTATLRPGTAQSAVKWSSSNTQVARVSQGGLVTPVKAG